MVHLWLPLQGRCEASRLAYDREKRRRDCFAGYRRRYFPKCSFSMVVPTKRDDGPKDLGVMHCDIQGSKTTHRKTSDTSGGWLSKRTILLIHILDKVTGNIGLY